MPDVCELLMTEPSHYEVSYNINPWMQPERWSLTRDRLKNQAILRWKQLYSNLKKFGADIHLLESVDGLPDLVFPANGAVLLNRKVLLSRFAYPQRRGEEEVFFRYFSKLARQGVVSSIQELPPEMFQEGAGDCLWDKHRSLFWSGYGQRSDLEASRKISSCFQCDVQPLELIDPGFYHLDVAMAILEKGEILYYPGAFSHQSQQIIKRLVSSEWLIEVSRSEAIHFNLNVISALGIVFMNTASARLRGKLTARGYYICEIDLTPFLLSGGAAACLTLRLDHCKTEPEYKSKEVLSGVIK